MPKKRKKRPATGRRPLPASRPRPERDSATLRAGHMTQGGPGSLAAHTVSAVPLDVTVAACGPVEEMEPQALGLTYWFDAPPDGPARAATIRFTGRRLDGDGSAGPKDRFVTDTTVDPVLPGSGRIAVTTRVLNLAPGNWQVEAASVDRADEMRGLPPAVGRGSTAFAPLVRVRAPGVRLGAWPALVFTGTVAGLATQALLAADREVSVLRLFAVTLLACVVGVLGAKTYYLVTHRGESTGVLVAGMSVQGFVIGCVGTVIAGALASGIAPGVALDLTAPGLLLGMTIGRLGCFFGGCCAGRATASAWGLWSSNRTLGTRRIPVQLMESAMAATVFVGTLVVVTSIDVPIDGLAFVGGLAAYIFGRQVLFPLRDVPRKTAHGRRVTQVLTAAVFLGTVALVVAG